MGDYRIISSDSHVVEPPDVWTDRMAPKFGDRTPRLVSEGDVDWWYVDGMKTNSCQVGSQAGVRFEDPEHIKTLDKWENVRPGGYIPQEHVKDMDLDGVDGNILYPTQGLFFYHVPGSELLSAMCVAYNDWLAEFCSSYSDRMKGIAMLNVDDIPVAIKEMERARKMGLAGALITVYPPEDRSYDEPEYGPLWAAAQDLDMPISLHSFTNRPGPGQEMKDTATIRPAVFASFDHWVRVSIAHMIFSRVFERFPGLKVGSVEHELSWIPFFLDQMDYSYTQRAHRETGWHRFKKGMIPSDFWHSNVFASFQEDGRGIRDRHTIGVDNLMWGSDYPHPESTFPRTGQILDRVFEGVPADEKAKIISGNASKLYHFD